MATAMPKGLETALTLLGEAAVGSIPLLWLWYPPIPWAGFFIVPAINLSAFAVLAVVLQALWPRPKGPGGSPDAT